MIQGICLRGGLLMGHEPDLREEALSAALLSFRPTYLYAVPRLREDLQELPADGPTGGPGALFERAGAHRPGLRRGRGTQRLGTGPGPGFDLKLQHSLYEKTVYRSCAPRWAEGCAARSRAARPEP